MAAPAVQYDERRISMMLDRLLMQAQQERASDIHIEPRKDRVRIRFRVDGVMIDRPNFPKNFAQTIVSRLKVLAHLDISEKRIPQDGVFHFERGGGTNLAFRISTFPIEHGEKVVLRLLDKNSQMLELDKLGVETFMADKLRRMVSEQNGILLVTGPTGSGKTSMLYALLGEVDWQQRNVVTLEDPIEYPIDGITQGQANPKAGFDFATGLRSILRQDPDVIMVGEIRDKETARVAMRAALTGHMVISTLHTNSSAETLVRLLDMGVEHYVISSALRGVLAQRLVRKLCPLCKVPRVHGDDQLFGYPVPRGTRIYAPGGCMECAKTGYRGRTGLYELITINEPFAELLKNSKVSVKDIHEEMSRQRLPTIRQTGVDKILKGETSIAELLRVT